LPKKPLTADHWQNKATRHRPKKGGDAPDRADGQSPNCASEEPICDFWRRKRFRIIGY
jgi:hypothetical protein